MLEWFTCSLANRYFAQCYNNSTTDVWKVEVRNTVRNTTKLITTSRYNLFLLNVSISSLQTVTVCSSLLLLEECRKYNPGKITSLEQYGIAEIPQRNLVSVPGDILYSRLHRPVGSTSGNLFIWELSFAYSHLSDDNRSSLKWRQMNPGFSVCFHRLTRCTQLHLSFAKPNTKTHCDNSLMGVYKGVTQASGFAK